MAYIKANKTTLQKIINDYKQLSSELDGVITSIKNFKESGVSASNQWSDAYYLKHVVTPNKAKYTNEEGELSQTYYQALSSAYSTARAKVSNYAKSYRDKLNTLPDLTSTKNKLSSVEEVLVEINKLILDFEDLIGSSKLNLAEVINSLDSLGENYSVETVTIQVDGEEQTVQVLMYTDEDGQQYTVAELVNAFYTYTGVTANNAVVLASKGLSSTELETELSGMVNATALGVDNQLQRGFYSVASSAGIEAMYVDAMGKEYNQVTVEQEYASVLGNYGIEADDYEKALSGVTNASTLGGMAMAGALMSGLNFKMMAPEEKEEVMQASVVSSSSAPTEVSNSGGSSGASVNTSNGEGASSGEATGVSGESKIEVTVEEVEQEELVDEEIEETETEFIPDEEDIDMIDEEVIEENPELIPEEEEDLEVLEPEEIDNPEVLEPEIVVSDVEAREIKNTMDTMDGEDSLENIVKDTITSEEIDNQARDQYYADQEKVIENRLNNYNKYESMTLEERIKALEDVGYDSETASILAQDNAKGQTAYIVGLEEQDLAKLSNEIAKNEGISELEHDTKFDDGHNLSYVESGNINVDMNLISNDVQVARKELTEAKYAYDDSITVANNAINKAKVVKEDYYNILDSIQHESGSDPKYWTEAQVNEYNKAVSNYNDAVQEANNATTIVQEKKAIYEQEKLEYTTTYEEYRKTTLETIGEALREKEEVLDEGIVNEITTTINEDGSITIGNSAEQIVRPPDAEIIPVVPKEEIM